MCSRGNEALQGEPNLRLLRTKPKKVLSLEEMEERRLRETIEIEQKLAELIKLANEKRIK